MSLLSRFRRTVLPSTARTKKHHDDDAHHYNYRKPTKSFNEKSVKPRSPQSYSNSHDDTINHNTKEKSIRSGTKLSRSSTITPNKSTKNRMDNENDALDNAALTRSNTFTLEEEANLRNGTYPRSKIKEKTPSDSRYRESNADMVFDEPKSKQKKNRPTNLN